MTRQISSVVKLTVPSIGNCASDHTTAMTSKTQRVATRLTMKPTTMAEIENRKKNEEPSRPNCSGWSFNSSMIGAPARPTTILSAKFTSMNRNSRKVIFQAPLGVGCVVMFSPGVSLLVIVGGAVDRPGRMLPGGQAVMQLAILDPVTLQSAWWPDALWRARQPHHDRVSHVIETVI